MDINLNGGGHGRHLYRYKGQGHWRLPGFAPQLAAPPRGRVRVQSLTLSKSDTRNSRVLPCVSEITPFLPTSRTTCHAPPATRQVWYRDRPGNTVLCRAYSTPAWFLSVAQFKENVLPPPTPLRSQESLVYRSPSKKFSSAHAKSDVQICRRHTTLICAEARLLPCPVELVSK